MPLVRLVGSFIGGVVLYLSTGYIMSWLEFVVLLTLLISSWFVFTHFYRPRYPRRWLFGVMAAAVMMLLGYQRAALHHELSHPDHFSRHITDDAYLRICITEPVAEKANSYQVVGRVTHILRTTTPEGFRAGYPGKDAAGLTQSGDSTDLQARPARGRLLLYLARDSLAAALQYGEVLITRAEAEPVRAPDNPSQFHYKRFLARKNIYHSIYRRAGQWSATGENQGNSLLSMALHLRERALSVLEGQGLQGREFAVVSALLLGHREYLDEDLQREFAGAGAMHILCVSGLHVGIIYMLMQLMLSRLQRSAAGRIVKTVLCLLLIWTYAAVTGLSPSVLRASAMFSFLAIGQCLNRQTNIYNTLAASALLLTMIDPYIVTRIGFQLSYLAVISIVALQPPLYRLIRCRMWLADKAWSLATVSIAAQLATGPLALYYFNQFPNYFLLTNLLVIPLASLVLYAGLLTLAFSWVPWAGYYFARVLHSLLLMLHSAVRWVEQLPGSVSEGVYVSLPETLMFFLVLVLGCFYLLKGRRHALLYALVILWLLMLSVGWRKLTWQRQMHFVVYSINQGTAIDFFTGRRLITLKCDAVAGNPGMIMFSAEGWRMACGSARSDMHVALHDSIADTGTLYNSWRKSGSLIQFGAKRIIMVHRANSRLADMLHSALHHQFPPDGHLFTAPSGNRGEYDSSEALHVDYLIVTQHARYRPDVWLAVFNPGMVIVDASNSYLTVQQWTEACAAAGIACWPIRELGAYVGY